MEVSSSKLGDRSGEQRLFIDTPEEGNATGGWVAEKDNENQYILIKFTEPYELAGIVTQGNPLLICPNIK